MREGTDAMVLTTGITLKTALDAAENLSGRGLEATVLHLPTIKPLDTDRILAYAAEIPVIITIEEHTLVGGLGSAVAEIIAEANFSPAKRFKRVGIPDTFPDQYGSQASLMERYAITAENLIKIVTDLVEIH
jgi:transketolase